MYLTPDGGALYGRLEKHKLVPIAQLIHVTHGPSSFNLHIRTIMQVPCPRAKEKENSSWAVVCKVRIAKQT